RHPKDGAVRMLLADPKGNLQCNLRLANAPQAHNGRSLTVIWVHIGWDSRKKLFHDCFSTDEVFVPSKRHREMDAAYSWTLFIDASEKAVDKPPDSSLILGQIISCVCRDGAGLFPVGQSYVLQALVNIES